MSREGFGSGQHTLHLAFDGGRAATPQLAQLQPRSAGIAIDQARVTSHPNCRCRTLSITFTVAGNHRLTSQEVDEWWYEVLAPAIGQSAELLPARPARPGYFIQTYDNSQNNSHQCDFEIYCPNPECELNRHAWAEQIPLSRSSHSAPPPSGGQLALGVMASEATAELPATAEMEWQEVPETFSVTSKTDIGTHPDPCQHG